MAMVGPTHTCPHTTHTGAGPVIPPACHCTDPSLHGGSRPVSECARISMPRPVSLRSCVWRVCGRVGRTSWASRRMIASPVHLLRQRAGRVTSLDVDSTLLTFPGSGLVLFPAPASFTFSRLRPRFPAPAIFPRGEKRRRLLPSHALWIALYKFQLPPR